MKGLVSLVGAGPGDPGLLTLKAKRRLSQADLIVYDYLANPAHLRHKKPLARAVCVGKRFRYHRYSQDRINRLILQEARAGRRVVRLKGGDPYLFGRGGEEALYLAAKNVPFEVIPGVTSATACAAYAGIPLTHRTLNASVTFLTGHRAGDDKLDSVRWEAIVALKGTIVVYMGLYNLGRITEKLIRAGMPSETPVSVIEWGTLPAQRSCQGRLDSIAAVVRRARLRPPSLIIIGEVVSLADRLGWFEKLPLFGKTVVVTRMKEKSAGLTDLLGEMGARVIELPALEIRPTRRVAPLDKAIAARGAWDWILFTSAYGVRAYFDRLRACRGLDARALSGVRIACVGAETARELLAYGLKPDLVPERFETASLARALLRRLGRRVRGARILLVRARIAPPLLERTLRARGARVQRVDAYETAIPRRQAAGALRLVREGAVDYVTFTSSSSARHFVAIVGRTAARSLARRARFASIGPVTSGQLRSLGLRPACEAKRFTVEGLAEALRSDALKRKSASGRHT